MQSNLLNRWVAVSMFTAPGSYMALNILNDREFLPWLKPEFVPYFGFPLLVILFASCLFGAKGLVNVAGNISERYKQFKEIERNYIEKKSDNIGDK